MDHKTLDAILSMSKMTLSALEREEFSKSVSAVLDYFQIINSVDTSGADPDPGQAEPPDAEREDIRLSGLSQADLSIFAKDLRDGSFVVPRILED